MIEVGLEIETFTEGMSFDEFQADLKTVRAVLYSLALIGEAAASLLPEVEAAYPEIPWADIRGIRNVVIHEYFRVDLDIVWEAVHQDLPSLIQQLEHLLNRLKAE
ncbi:MAG: DUF86 domain-containing protein [Acaryochloris sp. SU_5_25]|nr:DUF86 domain-containing protein [Acaryochloris sp. SU_5_25]